MSLHPSLAESKAGVERHTTRGNIIQFFNPDTYRGVTRLPETDDNRFVMGGERHTTKENIIKFFERNGNQTPLEVPSNMSNCQKRAAPSDVSSGGRPAAKAKSLSKHDLMEKFRLAAELNGIDWDDMAVS